VRAWLLLLAVVGVLLAPALPASAQEPAGGVVLIGAPGLRWDHVGADATPALHALLQEGSPGALSVRSASPRTCPGDGWVMAGTGNRARLAAGPGPRTCTDQLPTAAALPAIDRDNDRLRFDAQVGGLGQALARAGLCATAWLGNGAQLAAGRADGTVDLGPTGDVTAGALAQGLQNCPVLVVDAGSVHSDARAPADLARVDAVVAQARAAAATTGATLLVAGLADVSDAGERGAPDPRLHVALAAGPGFARGGLVSSSTRRAPYVQVVDLAPTVLALVGVEQPAAMTGQPWRRTDTRLTVAELVDADVHAGQMRVYTPRFFLLLVVAQIVLYGAAVLVFRHLSGTDPVREVVRRSASRTALAFAAAPVATYLANLVPWWRADPVLPALLGAVAAFDLLIVLLALAGPWRRRLLGPIGVVCGVTALVLAADLVTGARLQMSSIAGYSPLVAGRFAGVGNVAFAVFAASAILATACLVHGRSRRTVVACCAVIGLACVVVDGNPAWGSDFGGVLALIPGFAVLAMLAGGIRVSALRLLGVATSAVLAVTAFAAYDYSRPPQARSHLGRFAAQVLDGGALTVIERKASANLGLLTHSVLTLLVPLLVLFVAQVVLRPRGPVAEAFRRAPEWRAGLIGTLVMSLVGFAVNDSGVAVPALALTIAVPAAIAVGVRASEPAAPPR
jgi:hypothetical protein